jgi:hypothetical protein
LLPLILESADQAYRIRRVAREPAAVSIAQPAGVPYWAPIGHDPEATTMSHQNRLFAAALGAIALGCGPAMADAPQATTWQHHHENFTYFGITALYSCDGLEGKISQILLFLGARKDLRVQAGGCPRGSSSPSRMATVTADFDTLSAAADAPAAQIVQAQWTPFKLDARHPMFMGEGDCELMRAVQPMLTRDFSLRSLDYSVACTPHQLSIADFGVRGEVLKSSAAHSG